jgi:predicted RNA-binding protein with PUA-like domain
MPFDSANEAVRAVNQQPGSRYWLVKTEPDVYSYQDLETDGETGWDGVRNYQARNNLMAMRKHDLVLVYHSNTDPPGVVGVARVRAEHEPDPTQFDPTSPYYDAAARPDAPRWYWVRLQPERAVPLVTLERLRELPELSASRLTSKGNRLSVIEILEAEYHAIIEESERT